MKKDKMTTKPLFSKQYMKKNVPPNHCSLFANHFALKLRWFDPINRIRIKFEISKIFYETGISTWQSPRASKFMRANYVSQPQLYSSTAVPSPLSLFIHSPINRISVIIGCSLQTYGFPSMARSFLIFFNIFSVNSK